MSPLSDPVPRAYPPWAEALLARASEAIQTQRGALLCWVPVCLALGIGIYFSLVFEPPPWLHMILLCGAGAASAAAHGLRHTIGPAFAAIALISLGFVMAGVRAHVVAGPVLEFRYYGAVQGRVIGMDRSSSDKPRLTLDRVVLERMGPEDTPRRVRVSLHGAAEAALIAPGSVIQLTANLSPPPTPSEPGGFDFQRHAYFQKIGAVGYSRTPVMLWEGAAQAGWRVSVFKLRMYLSAAIRNAMPGQAGAVAAAVTTGDRSAMSSATYDALRLSNLAHLLAISGLHMGLLTGFIFSAARMLFSLVPYVALRAPVKKISAGLALIAGAGYLALSGGSIATERAFIMVSVMLMAVILDRRALTLRAVALAAIIVLCLRPEALLSPGFQMSFAATTGLIIFFGWFSRFEMKWCPKRAKPAVSLFLSSAVAGGATAPLAAAHFNVIAHYGLLANLISVPAMGAVVVPSAVVAGLLAPLGLAWLPLMAMELGLSWILAVGHFVSGLDGAVGRVATPDWTVLPLLSLGAVFGVLWRGHLRWIGLILIAVAAVQWSLVERPTILISNQAGLVGVLTPEGRILSKSKGNGFAARSWLENDGDGRDQFQAGRGWRDGYEVMGLRLRHVTGKKASASISGCRPETWIIANNPTPELPCRVWTPKLLRKTGAIAVYDTEYGPRIVTARQLTGDRLWNDARR